MPKVAIRVEVYVDESGHASEGVVFVMAGLGGTEKQWEGFADEWNVALANAGLNEPFHAVDFEGMRGQFEPLRADRERAVALHDELTAIITRHKLAMFGIIVHLEKWREMDAEAKRLNDPYHLATEALVLGIARDSGLTGGEPFDVSFVFEKRKDTAAKAERMFKALREHPEVEGRDKLTAFGFGLKGDPRLQAADLVAYEVRKSAIAELTGDENARWQVKRILPHLLVGYVTIDKK